MKFTLPRMTLADSFGSLLDIAADSGLDRIELSSPHKFGVGQHWQAVGNRMRAAMRVIEHEQSQQETADCQK